MLVVYPLLVSSTIPVKLSLGICKAAERFMVVYMMDEILTQLSNYKIKESDEKIDYTIDKYLVEQGNWSGGTISGGNKLSPPAPVIRPTPTTTKTMELHLQQIQVTLIHVLQP